MSMLLQYHLCRGLGVSTRQSRLHQDLALFYHIDLAIYREGVDSLSLPELQQVCPLLWQMFLRLCHLECCMRSLYVGDILMIN